MSMVYLPGLLLKSLVLSSSTCCAAILLLMFSHSSFYRLRIHIRCNMVAVRICADSLGGEVALVTIHTFEPERYYRTLGSHEPVLRIAPGDTVKKKTIDALGIDWHGKKVSDGPNPQTGPFYVEGAKPGDTLVMHLDRLTPNRPAGEANPSLAPNTVDPDYVADLPLRSHEKTVDWQVDTETGMARLVKPEPRLGHLPLPLAPMLGCFGVAPRHGQAISTATSAEHGGNMDYRGFVSGVTVYFPVFVDGALVFVGDGHAIQGDGEITGSGIEISFDVQFTVRLIEGKTIRWPRGENADFIFTVGNARPLDQAVQHATTEMLRWLQADYGLSSRESNLLLGYCVEDDLANMFDPAYPMVCNLRKQLLPPLA